MVSELLLFFASIHQDVDQSQLRRSEPDNILILIYYI